MLEQMTLVTKSYKYKEYELDFVISNTDGHLETDVWMCKAKEPAMKLWLFGIKNKTLDEVLKETIETIEDDDAYISGFNEADGYVR